jgi:hypothetical protein
MWWKFLNLLCDTRKWYDSFCSVCSSHIIFNLNFIFGWYATLLSFPLHSSSLKSRTTVVLSYFGSENKAGTPLSNICILVSLFENVQLSVYRGSEMWWWKCTNCLCSLQMLEDWAHGSLVLVKGRIFNDSRVGTLAGYLQTKMGQADHFCHIAKSLYFLWGTLARYAVIMRCDWLCGTLYKWRMVSSGMLRCVAIVRTLQEPHSVTSQKTPFFIVTAVKTSNPTHYINITNTGLKYFIPWK